MVDLLNGVMQSPGLSIQKPLETSSILTRVSPSPQFFKSSRTHCIGILPSLRAAEPCASALPNFEPSAHSRGCPVRLADTERN